jgi:hypothetical protein
MSVNKTPDPLDDDAARPTREVGDEGGSPGDVERTVDPVAGTGSEADETWRPTGVRKRDAVRDETGEGRRSP